MTSQAGPSGRLEQRDARSLGECLAQGGVAVFPTDTVYGLACDPQRPDAVERLYELKGRPAERPAAVMFFTLAAALRGIPELRQRELAAARALLPGAVTLLLPNRARRFELACARDPDTLGLRVPLLPQSLAALGRLDGGLLQSSANRTGEPAVRSVAELPRELREGADLVLDAGELPGTASTVLDLRDYEQRGDWSVVREGALAHADLRQALMLAS
jgi:L-threonylcarbamoyladenylate synthase